MTTHTQYYTGEPLFSFGWGLSYTTFDLALAVDGGDGDSDSESWAFTVSVTNTGARDGDEIVQLYWAPTASVTYENPGPAFIKKLAAFERVSVAVGETTDVPFKISTKDLYLTDADGNLVSAPGEYALSFEDGSGAQLATKVVVGGQRAKVVEAFPRV